jgi:glycosyltransferase involved in cell wall biosynthesis
VHSNRICYVTEVDLDEVGGAITNEKKTINCLKKLADVDVVFLQRRKFKSTPAALLLFTLQVSRSLSKKYTVYFSRGLISCFLLILIKPFHRSKIVHQTLSVPLASAEVKHLGFGRFELLIRYRLFAFLERLAIPRADMITVAAIDYARELIRIGVSKDKIRVVTFYVEDEFFQQPIKHVEGGFTFCYVGRFHMYHDLAALIQAFELVSNLENTRLTIVGNGPLRPTIEKEVAQRKLVDKVEFIGMIPHSSVPSFLSKVDSFVYLSRKSGLSTSLLEAAAAGKAIIALNIKEDKTLSRFFKHKKEIYLVDVFSPQSIADAMKLLHDDSQLRSRLAEGAKRAAKRYFSEGVTLTQLQTLITSLS